MTLQKIGLMGGTFDPVHCGHLQLAAFAQKQCKLDKLVCIPCAQPPHKSSATIASFKHRSAMLSLAGQGLAGFECNVIESTLSAPSYTVDTIRELRKHYRSGCSLFFIIGADAFLDIMTWKSHQEVLRSVALILSQRTGYKRSQLTDLLITLGYTPCGSSWRGTDGKKDIHILDKIPDNHSSSTIRAMIEKNESVQGLLPEQVVEYIRENKLYQTTCQPNNVKTDDRIPLDNC